MTIWIAFITLYIIAFCEAALTYSASESGRILSKAKSKKIKAYYWFKLIGLGLFGPIISLLVCFHMIVEIITKEKQEEDEDEDLP